MQPILDTVTVLIFLGVVQGVLLGVLFLARPGAGGIANRMFGLLMLSLAAIILEMMLCYSGYVERAIGLVDFSEPLNFAVGPLVYLTIRARLTADDRFDRRALWHFLPFALYFLYHLPYLVQSGPIKEFAWLEAWRAPDADAAGSVVGINVDPLHIRANVNEITILHIFAYHMVAMFAVVRAYHARGLAWWARADGELDWSRSFVLRFAVMGFGVLLVKSTFRNDLGDFYIALLITAIIYVTSIQVIGRSAFFLERPRSARKYEKSALDAKRREELLRRLNRLIEQDKPFLEPSISLAELARRIGASPHHLSQLLNEALGCSFHDFLARHRVEEAKCLLAGPERDRLRIEEIAEGVGYYSKSSFNAAFRRVTGLTPSQFRSSQPG